MRRVGAFLLCGVAAACAAGGGDSDVSPSGSSTGGAGPTSASSANGGAPPVATAAASGSGGAGSTASTNASTTTSTSTTTSSTATASSTATSSASAASASSSGAGGAQGGDPWFQIEYTANSQPTSPTWTFSPTPNYKSPDWAYSGKNFPEVWDVFNSIQVKSDPIGKYCAIIDGGDTFQAMLGFGKLKSVQDVEVVLEGRGYSVSSSGVFDVYNPLNNCGQSGVTMAHDWSVHTVKVSLAGCIIPGNTTQAIRIKPTSQGLALWRMKVTLVGASY